MDDLDQKILAALAADSSTPTALLARRVGVARSTVQARIDRLKSKGIIAGYTIRLGDVHLARRIRATVLLQVEARANADVVQRVRAIAEVEIIHSTSGRFDLILQIATETTGTLDQVLDRIGGIPGVRASESLIHLSTKLDRSVQGQDPERAKTKF
jgi:DNA-binding Lrp family transcriptional regulator